MGSWLESLRLRNLLRKEYFCYFRRIISGKCYEKSIHAPSQAEKRLQTSFLKQLAFDPGDQVFPLPVNFILRLEKRAAFLIPLRFNGFDLLLASEFLLQSERGDRGPASFLELAVEFLDFAFEADFQVIGPPV